MNSFVSFALLVLFLFAEAQATEPDAIVSQELTSVGEAQVAQAKELMLDFSADDASVLKAITKLNDAELHQVWGAFCESNAAKLDAGEVDPEWAERAKIIQTEIIDRGKARIKKADEGVVLTLEHKGAGRQKVFLEAESAYLGNVSDPEIARKMKTEWRKQHRLWLLNIRNDQMSGTRSNTKPALSPGELNYQKKRRELVEKIKQAESDDAVQGLVEQFEASSDE